MPGLSAPVDPPFLKSDGTGQTIGLIEFDNFQVSDVANFLAYIGLPAAQLTNVSEVPVNGGASAGPNQDEVLLDIDTEMLVAKGAKVVVYDGLFSGPGTSFQALFNAAIDGGSTIISNSWAYCEDQTTTADVQSLDSIFQNAEMNGITIFNGAGDGGSTCLDGSPNVISVPADSPNATAVRGTSVTYGPQSTYDTETWWNGSNATPSSGQGGFGVSRFFSAPPYQASLGLTNRSIPDVVAVADPADGISICQQSAGGCPTPLSYGGTSIAAPEWAGMIADMNQAVGNNIGALNQAIYPFANTSVFNNAASLKSDFAHVGLGSPSLQQMFLALTKQTVGTPSPTASEVTVSSDPTVITQGWVPADGQQQGLVVVILIDGNANLVSGKTVTLTANAGSGAQISPSSATTSIQNGAAVFTVTDTKPETVTFTATDTSDSVQLKRQTRRYSIS